METTTGTLEAGSPAQPHLKRVLGLWDLIYYGVILTSPIAAVPLFGEAQVLSHGHAVTTLLLAMVAMSVTAVSFGRMATVYPSSGSVYTYISKGLNPHVGFVVGWAMFLEYLFQPIQNALYAVLAIQRDGSRQSLRHPRRARRWTHHLHDRPGHQIHRAHQRSSAFLHGPRHGFRISSLRPSATSSSTSISPVSSLSSRSHNPGNL